LSSLRPLPRRMSRRMSVARSFREVPFSVATGAIIGEAVLDAPTHGCGTGPVDGRADVALPAPLSRYSLPSQALSLPREQSFHADDLGPCLCHRPALWPETAKARLPTATRPASSSERAVPLSVDFGIVGLTGRHRRRCAQLARRSLVVTSVDIRNRYERLAPDMEPLAPLSGWCRALNCTPCEIWMPSS
jgi:hypothetical protein